MILANSKRLIVISLDSLGSTDFNALKRLPHFRKILKYAAYSSQVKTIYPSLTYPAHTTIVTGKTPANHGIINNTLLQADRPSPDWFWQREYINGTTLYDEALAQKMKVAALLWPVTAKSNITWNMPEIFANRPWSNQILTSAANGSLFYQLSMNQKFGYLRDGIRQPNLDNFTNAALKYTLQHKKPDLTLVHFTDLDSQRHNHGVNSEQAMAALRRHDRRLGELLITLKQCEMSIRRDTTLVILGDHGQINTKNVILLNKIFKTQGYLSTRNKKITDWKVICKHCDGSAYIYIDPELPANERSYLKNEVYDLLMAMKQEKSNGIAAIYTKRKAQQLGADPECTFMLEARKGFYFQDEIDIEDIPKKQKATHGYHPNRKNYQTVFIAVGPDIRPRTRIGKMSLLDEAPTLAKILGVALPDTEGRVLEEIFIDSAPALSAK